MENRRPVHIINIGEFENRLGRIRLALDGASRYLQSQKKDFVSRCEVGGDAERVLGYLIGLMGKAKIGLITRSEYDEVMSFNPSEWYINMRQRGLLK